MTFVPHWLSRRHLRPQIVLVCLIELILQLAFATSGSALDACRRWPQDRLIVAQDLQSRRFLLEGKGQVQLMRELPAAEPRSVYHRTFSLSLDVAELASLFYGNAPRTCLIGRDQDRTQSLRIPVFFVGRIGESAEDLKANAENVAFAPSESLEKGENFSEIAFRLRRGGSRFNDIRPFFRCGLPGLMLCEDTCPDGSVGLAASLASTVVNSQSVAAVPPPRSTGQANPPPHLQPGMPETAQEPPAPPPAIPPKAEEAPAPPTPQTVPSPEPPAPGASSQQEPPRPIPAPPPMRHFVLTFELRSGEPLNPEDVLEAERSVAVEGTNLALTAEGLTADLTEQDFQKATSPDYLKTLFRHHVIVAVKTKEGSIVLTVDQLYARMDRLRIEIHDPAGLPVRTCDLALDVLTPRRLGTGWAKIATQERAVRGLSLFEDEGVYKLRLPTDIDENQLLISTSEPGDAAKLSNMASGCELEPRPLVQVEEIRSGTILRALQPTGPVFIALLSTDSEFAGSIGSAAADEFWASALNLAREVSKEHWERNILARAQAPGPHQNTAVLEDMRDGVPAAEQGRADPVLNMLREGSRLNPEPRSIIKLRPVERFHLDLALRPIRRDAHISPRGSVRQEALLFISGSMKASGSYFCQHPVRRDTAPWTRPQWVRQARKVFVLEVWSEATVAALQKSGRAAPPEGAPEGVFFCKIPGADGEKIELYGVAPEILSRDGERTAAFDYLKAHASSYLKP